MSGAKALIATLEREGVEVIFGYPGGSVLPIYDALMDSSIRHILVRHEQCAAHAADGYARVTGKVGVCLATSGPGATNLVTGIATAYMDSIPLVAITGQVARPLIGTDAFQEADITGITLPIVKHSYLVKEVRDLPRIVREAFEIASKGRPGPVLIDLPVDCSREEFNYKYPEEVKLRGFKPTIKGHVRQIRSAVKVIIGAKRPVIYAGGGVIRSGASEEIMKLAKDRNIPVATTLMGLGAFPESHPMSVGHPGMHGKKYANLAMPEADVIVAVGVRFSDRVTGPFNSYAADAKIVHIDVDPAEIGKNVKVSVPIVGDIKHVLVDLNKALNESDRQPPDRNPWIEKINSWKKEFPMTFQQDEVIKPQYIIQQISDLTGGNAIITTDVGQAQMWTAQYYSFEKPNCLLTSGGLGTMGYGLPAAIGAQIGKPDATVWQIAGDGSFQMNSQELAVAIIEGLPIKIALLNNGYLGMVRQWQELFFDKRYSYTDLKRGISPDFVALAKAYGADAVRVEKPEEVRPALERAMKAKKTFLIDFIVNPEENVFPMVKPGEPINVMIEE